jgi:hypothetical protein
LLWEARSWQADLDIIDVGDVVEGIFWGPYL